MHNIVLLNLSDIHCFGDRPEQQRMFDLFRISLKEQVNKYPQWRPDFIIVPGDLKDGHAKDRTSAYNNAYEFIDNIRKDFRLWPENIISVPGNHDRSCPRNNKDTAIKEFEEVSRIFSEFQQGKEEEWETFCEYQDKYFKAYCERIAPFFPAKSVEEYEFIPVESLGSFECNKTMGIKVFPALKILFLMLNTEWLSFPGFFKEEKVRIGRRLLKGLVNKIHENYTDFIVVSVMHHPPYLLDWEEKNVDQMTLFNPYHMLLGVSDMIISGHDHLISSLHEPEYLAFNIPHFQLGSFACEAEKEKDIFLNSASLLKIDAISNQVQMHYADLTQQKGDFNWHFYAEENVYPIRGRFGKIKNNITPHREASPYTIDGVDILWLKRREVPVSNNEAYKHWLEADRIYIIKEILWHFYYGRIPESTPDPHLFIVDKEKVCLLSWEEWLEQKNTPSSEPIHYIVYAEKVEMSGLLQQEKQDFLLNGRILKDTLSVIILQNNK